MLEGLTGVIPPSPPPADYLWLSENLLLMGLALIGLVVIVLIARYR